MKHRHRRWVFARGRKNPKPVNQTSTRAWRTAVKKIGRPGLRFHDLRHTWASWHVQAGTPLAALQALGGWRTASSTQRYAHLDSSSLRQYVEAPSLSAANVPTDRGTMAENRRKIRRSK
jgi:integrase